MGLRVNNQDWRRRCLPPPRLSALVVRAVAQDQLATCRLSQYRDCHLAISCFTFDKPVSAGCSPLVIDHRCPDRRHGFAADLARYVFMDLGLSVRHASSLRAAHYFRRIAPYCAGKAACKPWMDIRAEKPSANGTRILTRGGGPRRCRHLAADFPGSLVAYFAWRRSADPRPLSEVIRTSGGRWRSRQTRHRWRPADLRRYLAQRGSKGGGGTSVASKGAGHFHRQKWSPWAGRRRGGAFSAAP